MQAAMRRLARRVLGVLYLGAVATRSRGRRVMQHARAIPADLRTRGRRPIVLEAASDVRSDVDHYWSRHLVRLEPFASAHESAEYLEWRFGEYPQYRELMELWGDHDGEIVLDYGCGPGDDTVGFLLHTRAQRVIGVDVSSRALELARRRIALHGFPEERVELVHVSDAAPVIPLADASVDFVHSSGVLHHTTAPDAILRELRRVLRTGGRSNVMVYNRGSVWFHLYAAYVLKLLRGDDAPIDDVFRRSTDGPGCPISVAYAADEFLALAEAAGFEGAFVGGYPARLELELLERFLAHAARDERLPGEHRAFLSSLECGDDGLPRAAGLLAGIGGVYRLFAR